jgi:leucyl-tRNA synthetase
MAVPAQDERDWEFAEVFNLPIIRTVQPPEGWEGKAFTGDGPAINSAFLDGLKVKEAKAKMIAWLEQEGKGEGTVTYKLRDWLFSRQRYWGEPFPILHGEDGTVRAVNEADLPVALPPMEDFKPTASDDPDAPPRPPLARADEDWRIVTIDGQRFERELNTMPQWAGSCWYYLRFIDNKNPDAFVAGSRESYWMGDNGVDLYIGGVEHAVLHLLYARFWHKVLYDLGHVSTKEPFGRLFNQGYIQAYAYRDERGIAVDVSEVVNQNGRPAMDVQDQQGQQYFYKGEPVTQEYGKMGKSLKNAVSPDEINEEYGCDTLRLYEMYMGPLEASKPWNTRDIVGVNRFLRRVWRNFVDADTDALLVSDEAPTDDQMRMLHKTIERMTTDMERLSFNTSIAALIECLSEWLALDRIPRALAEPFVLMLAPLAPHMAEELWQRLGHTSSLAYEPWPVAEERWLVQDTIELVVQVNGKVRGSIQVPADADKDTIIAAAREDGNVARHLDGVTIRREIYVPGRLVNIVAN